MKSPTRRGFALLMPALAAAQQSSENNRHGDVLPSKAYSFEQLKSRQNGPMKSYQILRGNTHANFPMDLHETELGPGAAPHPPHRHAHEEMLFIREGQVEVTVNGQATLLGPGSCAYLASNDLHGYRNPGAVPAKYFVLALGGE